MSLEPQWQASGLQDPARQRAGRADVRVAQVDQGVGSDLLHPNPTWEAIRARARFPMVPGDPVPAQEVAQTSVDTPQSANTTTVVKLDFEPDEALLRQRLTDLLREAAQTEAALQYASAAHERSMHHRAQMQKQHARFIGLDQEIAASTAETIKSGAPMPDYAGRKLDRSEAAAALEAAVSAEAMLLVERGECAGAAVSARSAVDRCVAQILACHGEALAQEHAALTARREVLLVSLLSMGHAVRATFGPATRAVLAEVDDMVRARPRAHAEWDALAETLRRDPAAELPSGNSVS
jgi:hypothetical protein